MLDSDLPLPENEQARLAALRSYDILDSAAEERFDNLTKLASEICEVPVCLISLIDENRQWFKSKVGLDAIETPRNISFCQFAIMESKIFEVENALEDDRFKDNVLVQEDPNIRFYAGSPLIDKEGFALGTLCVIDDKPKKLDDNQKRALNTLAKEIVFAIQSEKEKRDQAKYKKFFEMSVDCLCIAGTDGFFKEINPAFPKLLGFTEEEILSKPFLHFIHPEDVERTLKVIEQLSKGKNSIAFQNRFINNEGRIIQLSWNSSSDKNTGELFAVAHDVTENSRTLNQLEILNQDLDEFAHIVSHDLKAPLSAVTGLTSILQEELDGKIDKSAQEIFELLKSRVKKMESLIQGVLDYTLSTYDAQIKSEVDLNKLIPEIIKYLDVPASIRFSIDPKLPTLNINKIQIQQVFQNLITNSIKYGAKEESTH